MPSNDKKYDGPFLNTPNGWVRILTEQDFDLIAGEVAKRLASKNPFYVSPWLYELLPKECEAIAKNYFNGEVVVLPKKYEEDEDAKVH